MEIYLAMLSVCPFVDVVPVEFIKCVKFEVTTCACIGCCPRVVSDVTLVNEVRATIFSLDSCCGGIVIVDVIKINDVNVNSMIIIIIHIYNNVIQEHNELLL